VADALHSRYCAAFCNKDAESLVKIHDSDCVVFPGPPVSGAALHGLEELRPLIDGTIKSPIKLAFKLLNSCL
jgi:limonene-1,2-epoxide hydrolase